MGDPASVAVMAQLSKRMEAAAEADRVLSRDYLVRSVTGRPATVGRALDALVEAGHVVVAPGRSQPCVLVRPFRAGADPVAAPAEPESRGPRLLSYRAYAEHVRVARRLLVEVEGDAAAMADADRVVAVAGAHAVLGLAIAVRALADAEPARRRGGS